MKVHIKTSYDIFHVHTQDHRKNSTIAEIKEEISKSHKGKPPLDTIELLCAGKVLRDDITLGSICGNLEETHFSMILSGGRKQANEFGMSLSLDELRNRERKPHSSDPIGEAFNARIQSDSQKISKLLSHIVQNSGSLTLVPRTNDLHGFRCPHNNPGRVRVIAAAYQPQFQPGDDQQIPQLIGPDGRPIDGARLQRAFQQDGNRMQGGQQMLQIARWANWINVSLLIRLCLVVALFLGAKPTLTRTVIVIGSAFIFYLYQLGALNRILPKMEADPPAEEALAPLTTRELCERFVIGFFASLNPAWHHRRRIDAQPPVDVDEEVAHLEQVIPDTD